MSAQILPFPGVTLPPEMLEPAPDLEPGRKALLLKRDGDGYFSVRLHPAVTAQDRRVMMRFSSAVEALEYAHAMQRQYQILYQLVIDDTGIGGGDF